jgi:hypothetical protein
MVAASNVSFASPLADAKYAPILGSSHIDEALATISNLSGWTIALTVLALLVAYDQCKSESFSACILHLYCLRFVYFHWILANVLHSQLATSGRRAQLLAQHGKLPLSVRSWSP